MSRKNKSTQRRVEANRRTAQSSAEEGKARSAENASHPVTKAQFLHSEDERQFQTLLGEYLQTYQPQHRDEYDLLKEAVYAKWRQERFWLAETAHLEMAIARNERTLQKELPVPTPPPTWPTRSPSPLTCSNSTSATASNSTASTFAASKNSATSNPPECPPRTLTAREGTLNSPSQPQP